MSGLVRFNLKNKGFIQSVRFASTQYIPGRKGYAPGFEAPEGTREETKVTPVRRNPGHSLPSHFEGKNKKELKTTSPKKLYREALRVQRHEYAHELLEKYGQKQLKSAEKLALAQEKAQQEKANFVQEKKQQQAHEKEVVELLNLSEKSKESANNRQQQRVQNRLALTQAQQEERRKQLLKLYANTASFVTLENLDSTVDAVMSSEGRSFHVGFNELMNDTTTVQTEIERRKEQLKEVMGL